MSKLTNEQANQLSILAKKTENHRKLTRQVNALKKECDVILQELEATAKSSKNKLSNGEFAVSFKKRSGGDYYQPKWSKYGIDKIISL
tara:strand:+ start:3804 stop:4067 length:264 start_codon:yes stop_codon:yes gene_type:complete